MSEKVCPLNREQLVELYQAHRDISKDEAEAEALAALRRMLPDAERAFDATVQALLREGFVRQL